MSASGSSKDSARVSIILAGSFVCFPFCHLYIYVTIYIYVYIYLDPEEPTFFKGLYKEITIRNPRKVGSLGSRHVYNTMHQPCMYDALYGFSGLYFVGQEPAWVLPLRMSLEELNLLQEKWVYLLNPKPKP